MIRSILAISIGAALGALLRWVLSINFNALYPAIPPGTWLANMIGGYLIGISLGFFGSHPALPPEWRLFVVTGFLGGLTTFSTFSAEVTTLIQQQRILPALAAISVHVVGSLVMTGLGLITVSAFKTN